MTIRTFYRPDNSMVDLLINNLVGGCLGIKETNGHRFIAVLKRTASTERFATVHEHECTKGPSYFGADDQIEIGVSLSQITFEQFARLANKSNGRNCSQYFGVVTSIDNLKVTATSVPNIYQGVYGYYWLKEVKRTPLEQRFADLLNGFDFYYQYSDDINVHRRWDKRLEEIKAQGASMGLSTDVMLRIYKESFN